MTKQEIIDYIMTTPSNPNKAVLEGMLDSFSDGEGGGGSSRILLYENDVTFPKDGASQIKFAQRGEGLTNLALIHPEWAESIGALSIEIDGEVVYTGEYADSTYSVGLSYPGDSDGIAKGYASGIQFGYTLSDNKTCLYYIASISIDSNKISAEGTHSVKLYKEA